MKVLCCKDAGYLCDFEARGPTAEVMKVGAKRVKEIHGVDLEKMKQEEISEVKALIKDG